MNRAAAGVLAAALIASTAAGCGASPVPSAAASPSPSAAASPSPPAHPTPSTVPSTESSSVASAPGPSIVVDASLVGLLPATLVGLDRQVDSSVDAEAFSDPGLAQIASAAASALYVDPATSDFAYATIIRLREPSIDETSFRAYRDSFDRGACSQAGGVTGNAQAELGGRTTYIGACAGGLYTYHAFLTADRAILSISSAGAKRLGEQLAAAVSG